MKTLKAGQVEKYIEVWWYLDTNSNGYGSGQLMGTRLENALLV